MARSRPAVGMTLTELVVALAIVALLMGIAVPSYRSHVLRAHRSEAMRALLALAAEQERYFLVTGRYADMLDAAPDSAPPGLRVAATSETGRYTLGIERADESGFLAVASPAVGGPQVDDHDCARYAIDDAGRRTARDAAGRDSSERCWR